MSGAYAGIWQLISPQPLSPEQVALARKLVGSMLDTGVPQRQWNLADGSSIHVLLVNGFPKVTFTPAPATTTEPLDTADLWVPRGFVVYPAWQDAPFGYGLPIVKDPEAGAYDPRNLAPGLDTSRWTAGGPCGEVLVSPDLDAGYPQNRKAIPVPLLYHPTLGPGPHWTGDGAYDQRAPDGAWASYRMELAAPVANYSDEDVAAARALFEQINAYRAGAGVTTLALLPRGYYRPAKVMASIMLTNGSTDETSTSYPATYRTPADRLTKDGFSATVMGVTGDSFERGDHPTSFELRHLGGGAVDVLGYWQGVPEDDARLTLDVGQAAFGDVGNRGGYWAANVTERTRWIEAGNMSWQGADAALPPISWMGFASLNLAWETYPAVYDFDNRLTAPLVPLISFTGALGDCWLSYPRSPAPLPADVEPAMARHVYCRGRAIAMAPEGALVWGACVMAVTVVVGEVEQRMDRLILLAHHASDQAADYTHDGWTRYLRVWWVDVPRRALALDPQQVIVGTDPDDALAWRGGTVVDMGHMPPPSTGGTVPDDAVSSLKYASQWRFYEDGSRAVCLRDYGLYTDYSDLVASGLVQFDGLRPRAVELVFGASSDDLSVSTVWHDYTAGATAATHEAAAGGEYEFGALPVAVDYDTDGSLIYAYRAQSVSALAGGSPASGSTEWTYVGTGSADVRWASDLKQRVAVAANKRTSTIDFRWTGFLQVADVREGAFVVEGMHPELMADTLVPNSTYVSCWPFTDMPAHGVRMVIGGRIVDERWFAIPDGAVVAPVLACDVHEVGAQAQATYLPLAASANVQSFWAARFEQNVFSYQVSPTPQALWVRDDDTADGLCGCTVSAWDLSDRSHLMEFSELNPRGGHALASVPLPDADWLIFAKAV